MSLNSQDAVRETPGQQRHAWVWIMLMVNIVFLLLLMTLGIIALRVGNYLPETDIVFIAGKNTDVAVGDNEKTRWEANEDISIFDAHYVNKNGETTVESDDGMSIIAPGTEIHYQFTMYNNSNVAVVYEADLDMFIKLGGKTQGYEMEENFPLKVKLYTEDGEYLIGSDNDFVGIAEALVAKRRKILGAESYETFNLMLVWDFEGDDALDTDHGDLSAREDLTVTLAVDTYAEEHFDPAAQGGTAIDASKETEIGGTVRWVWILLLLINTAIMIFYVSWLMNKRLQKW